MGRPEAADVLAEPVAELHASVAVRRAPGRLRRPDRGGQRAPYARGRARPGVRPGRDPQLDLVLAPARPGVFVRGPGLLLDLQADAGPKGAHGRSALGSAPGLGPLGGG